MPGLLGQIRRHDRIRLQQPRMPKPSSRHMQNTIINDAMLRERARCERGKEAKDEALADHAKPTEGGKP